MSVSLGKPASSHMKRTIHTNELTIKKPYNHSAGLDSTYKRMMFFPWDKGKALYARLPIYNFWGRPLIRAFHEGCQVSAVLHPNPAVRYSGYTNNDLVRAKRQHLVGQDQTLVLGQVQSFPIVFKAGLSRPG